MRRERGGRKEEKKEGREDERKRLAGLTQWYSSEKVSTRTLK